MRISKHILTALVALVCVLSCPTAATAQRLPPAPSPPSPCGGVLQPPCPPPEEPQPEPQPQPEPPPPQPAVGDAAITLRASEVDVALKPSSARITLSGQVTGAPAGRPTRLMLEYAAPDYRRSFKPYGVSTDPNGHFEFRTRLGVTTTYRIVVAPGEPVRGASEPVTVRAWPFMRLHLGGYDGERVELTLNVGGPNTPLHFTDDVIDVRSGTARRAYFYMLPRGTKRLRRIAVAPLRDEGCGGACSQKAQRSVRVTRTLLRSKAIVACLSGTAWRGVGLPDPQCGRRVVRAR